MIRTTPASLGRLVARPALWAALTVIAVCVPAEPHAADVLRVHVADLMSLALVATAAASLVRGGARPGRWVLLAAPAAVAVTVAAVTASDLLLALPGLARFLQVFVLVPVAVAVAVRQRSDVLLVGGAVAAVALVQAAIGFWQTLTGSGASYGGQMIRAVGTFGAGEVMALASMVSFGLIIALAVALAGRPSWRAAALIAAAALCPPLVMSLSRGTWLAAGCAVVVMLVLRDARLAARAAMAATASAVLLALVGGPASGVITERVASISSSLTQPDKSVTDRFQLWQAAAGMWRDHPVTGVGPRGFAAWRDTYAPLALSSGSDIEDEASGYRRQPLLSPHNMYLLVLSEQGLAGLAAFALLVGGILVRSLTGPGRTRPAGLAAAGFMTWLVVDFAYADVGGSTSLVMSVMLGLALGRTGTTALPARRPAC
ncbi:O-antigen ligase family protein [Nonomuraea spiralis]|uniref:O-antigen ligase family protein n=1 Tax=Nonomuraea spiralis TaxID=46182 RepID=A0ABV5IGS7_9ACTN|nr:O-antigen ligase family protein [Nonomuraea spiralis]GGS97991.1 membrane protein [Nonomuraea spiralis]